MPMLPTYSAAEAEPVEAFQDQRGKLHHTREAAITANFDDDLMKAVTEYCKANDTMPVLGLNHALRWFAETYPDHLRILIGDRDET